jgi:hypothetical protein
VEGRLPEGVLADIERDNIRGLAGWIEGLGR